MNIGIIGGSIAGLACGALLKHIGAKVTLFERSAHKLEDRGAGVMLPIQLVANLQNLGILDDAFQYSPIEENHIYVTGEDHCEQLLASRPVQSYGVNWGELYTQLLNNIDDKELHLGHQITQLNNHPTHPSIILDDGTEHSFDLIIGADGYNSYTRKHILPEYSEAEFAHYVAWRGLHKVQDDAYDYFTKPSNRVTYHLYNRGHLLTYCIPQRHTKQLTVNWVFYEAIPKNKSPFYLQDKHDETRMSIPYHLMTEDQLTHINQLANTVLPTEAAQLIKNTKEPFMQAIVDLEIDQYVIDRIALIGDASIILRPHTGAGSTKAITDASALAHALKNSGDINQALHSWNEKQIISGKNLFGLGKALGDLLVTQTPNWQELDEEGFFKLWKETTSPFQWYLSSPK